MEPEQIIYPSHETLESEILEYLKTLPCDKAIYRRNHGVSVRILFNDLTYLEEIRSSIQSMSVNNRVEEMGRVESMILVALRKLKVMNCCRADLHDYYWFYVVPIHPSHHDILNTLKSYATKNDAKSLRQIADIMGITNQKDYISLCSSLHQLSHERRIIICKNQDGGTVYYCD